jgi:hypothetical protein
MEVRMPMWKVKTMVEEKEYMSDNDSVGEEQPSSKKVIINLEMDHQISNANAIPICELDDPTQIHQVNITDSNNYIRHIDPFKPECVAKILSEISIGPDTMPNEHQEVEDLIAEFADCFILVMSEINMVPGAVHKLNILSRIKFYTRIRQRSMNPAQKKYLHTKVDEMARAGIIAPIHPRDV